MSIKFVICLNKQGALRLIRLFEPFSGDANSSQSTIAQIYKLISSRDHRHQSNFVEFSDSTKLVYKRYAGLYFVMGVGLQDEELIYLSHIHLLVEVLDAFFGNVCELDIVFNFHKAYMILDELIIGGEIQETCKDVILERVNYLDRLS
ncbi:Aps2p [Lachancea thermotolerans CBS 6340]|uniref:AP complex subunit sigma n=1 Tax=Lachancea thermotolerans (strain ATCC 56472 / CBS 6340 / NRRL Y-8284) TaxID=559295 RepID=C5DDP7_LACTC|nr:KLTH0C02706p [Lachancea thermotolerans CBS 6340]CAR21908.1 KLTH0C02706p [Lachancea thermotolerans CBS 6340]